MIIGAPKNLEDIPPFSVPAMEQFEQSMNDQLAGGTPVELPLAMALGSMCQIATTLRAYRTLLAEFCEIDEDIEDFNDHFKALSEKAQTLLDTPEPPPVQAASKLLTP